MALDGLSINDDILIVRGLPAAGSYDVYMDGEWVLKTSSVELERGLRLQENERAPTFKQSLELARLNAKRNDEAVRPYRDLQGKMKGARRKYKDSPKELEDFRNSIAPELVKLLRLAETYENEIHELAVPKAYKLEVRLAE